MPDTPVGARIVERGVRVESEDLFVVRVTNFIVLVFWTALVEVITTETPGGSAAERFVGRSERVGLRSDEDLRTVLRLRDLVVLRGTVADWVGFGLRELEIIVPLELDRLVAGAVNTPPGDVVAKVPGKIAEVSRAVIREDEIRGREVLREVTRGVLRVMDCEILVNLLERVLEPAPDAAVSGPDEVLLRIVLLGRTVVELVSLVVDAASFEVPGRGRLSLLLAIVVRDRDCVLLQVREPDLVLLVVAVITGRGATVVETILLPKGPGGDIGVPMTLAVEAVDCFDCPEVRIVGTVRRLVLLIDPILCVRDDVVERIGALLEELHSPYVGLHPLPQCASSLPLTVLSVDFSFDRSSQRCM